MNNIRIENNATNVKVRIENMENGQPRVIIEPVPEQVELSEIKLGERFKIGEFAFKAIRATPANTPVIRTGYIMDGFWNDGEEYEFGDSNNYADSDIRNMLNGNVYEKLAAVVGADNILEHTVNLTSEDGLKDYGSCVDKVSLLTEDMYRQNREYLPNTGKWWWLATPYSTESNGYSRCVCGVVDDGTLGYCGCGNGCAVRPFCIFNPSLLVSRVDG